MTLNKELANLDPMISEKVTEHRHTQTLLSMPGFGPVLAAEFLGATGGDLAVIQTADRFAGVAGLAPTPRDSGRLSCCASGHGGSWSKFQLVQWLALYPEIWINTDTPR